MNAFTRSQIYINGDCNDDDDRSFDKIEIQDTDEGLYMPINIETTGDLRDKSSTFGINFNSVEQYSAQNTEKALDRKLRAFQDSNNIYENQPIQVDLTETQEIHLFQTRRMEESRSNSSLNQEHLLTRKRSIDQFLQDQKTLEDLRLSRQLQLQDYRSLVDSQNLKEKPTLNKKSYKIVASKENVQPNVYQRLYQSTSKSNLIESYTKLNNNGGNFQRAIQASQRLHQQSKERIIKNYVKTVEKMQLEQQSMVKINVSQHTKKLISEKVIKELKEVFKKLGICDSEHVSQADFMRVMEEMRYFSHEVCNQTNSREIQIIQTIWTTLGSRINYEMIAEFCKMIEGGYSRLKNSQDLEASLKLFNDNKRATNVSHTVKQNEYTFRPKLSHSTSKLAAVQRERKLSQSTANFKKDQLIMIPIETQREHTKVEDLSECTFQPKILKSSQKVGPSGMDRLEQLYKKNQKSFYERRDKSKEDYEFERSAKECTFQPYLIARSGSKSHRGDNTSQLRDGSVSEESKIHNFSMTSSIQSKVNFAKYQTSGSTASLKQKQPRQTDRRNLQETAATSNASTNHRIVNILPIKETVCFTQHTKQGSFDTDIYSSSKVLRPLIFVDVNIAPGKQERITVFPGDTALGLAEDFAVKHHLSRDMHVKLEKLLESQIQSLLRSSSQLSISQYLR